MIHSYVIGRGNTATAYLHAGVIRPVPGATADAVVDVQVQRTGGESRLKDEEVVLFFLAEKRAERTCGEEKMATPGWTEKKRSSAPMRRGSVPQKIYWEGKILNKISKKIISLVTMAAFVLTLVPATAFGAEIGGSTTTTPGVAEVTLDKDGQTVVLDSTKDVTATVSVDPAEGTSLAKSDKMIGLWVGDTNGVNNELSKNVKFTAEGKSHPGANNWTGVTWVYDGTETVDVTATFTKAGTYPIYAGYWTQTPTTPAGNFAKLTPELVGTITVVNTDASTEDSRLLIDGKVGPADAIQADPQKFEFNILNADNVPTKLPLVSNVYVWVEDSNDKVVKDAVFDVVDGDKDHAVTETVKDGIWQVTTGDIANGDKLTVTFPDAGDGYTIHAGVATDTTFYTDSTNKVDRSAVTELKDITVNVADAEVFTNSIAVNSVTDAAQTSVNGNVYNFRINDEVTPSDTKVYTVKGTATTENGAAAENEKLYVSADKGMNLQGLAEDGTVTTNAKGEFTFKFTLTDAGQYEVTLRETNNDAKATLIVTQGDVDAVKIAKVKDGGKVLAGTDKDYGATVENAMLSDAVQFAITDAYGRDAVGPGVLADEAAANLDADLPTGVNHADSLEVKAQPQKDGKNTVDANDFLLAWDDEAGVYTLQYVGNAKDLVAGDYSVRVALNNGGKQAVTVNFTAVEFGTAQEIVLDTAAAPKAPWDNTANNNAITAIDDTVALGQYVVVTPKYVDENGLKVKINNYSKLQVGINGDAVADRHINSNWIGFVTPENIAANNSLVGSIITVKVNDADAGLYTEKELTVVKNYQAETLSVDPVQGVVGEANTVNVTVVDADGNLSKVNGKLTATLVSQSNEDANVDVKVNPDVRDGKASIYMESDAAGTADVRLVVEAANGELYGTTFTYTFGDEDEYAGRYVVMTIGSSDYLINNEIVKGDAAPYVDDAWRTMVPFRVLGEAFGAEVDWNQEAQSVTYTVGDTEIVMTIGENTYTLNGEEQTMDTAPVLSGDRTYVPVRFVAEDLGFEVTPLYDVENGATASVVFQK